MREIAVPAPAEKKEKIQRSLRRKCSVCNVFFYIFLALSVAGFLGAIVSVIVFEFSESMSDMLLYILLGAFFAAGALFGGLAYLFSRLLTETAAMQLDFSERCDSEKSFYVGEGTLATFGDGAVLLHGDKGDTKNIRIPYEDIRLFSVCTRTAPKEKGEWSVVMELPSRYLAKNGKADKDEKVLVQTDAKERLNRVIAEEGLSLLGEERKIRKHQKFVPKTKFYVPVPDKRRRALLMSILGFLVAAAGIPAAIWWNVTAGSFLSVIGLFLGMRCLASFLGAKSVFSVYGEGIFWKEAGGQRIFLKWEEIESVSRDTVNDTPVLKVQCIYGDYHLPDIAGVYEYLGEFRPEKCGAKDGRNGNS